MPSLKKGNAIYFIHKIACQNSFGDLMILYTGSNVLVLYRKLFNLHFCLKCLVKPTQNMSINTPYIYIHFTCMINSYKKLANIVGENIFLNLSNLNKLSISFKENSILSSKIYYSKLWKEKLFLGKNNVLNKLSPVKLIQSHAEFLYSLNYWWCESMNLPNTISQKSTTPQPVQAHKHKRVISLSVDKIKKQKQRKTKSSFAPLPRRCILSLPQIWFSSPKL